MRYPGSALRDIRKEFPGWRSGHHGIHYQYSVDIVHLTLLQIMSGRQDMSFVMQIQKSHSNVQFIVDYFAIKQCLKEVIWSANIVNQCFSVIIYGG